MIIQQEFDIQVKVTQLKSLKRTKQNDFIFSAYFNDIFILTYFLFRLQTTKMLNEEKKTF